MEEVCIITVWSYHDCSIHLFICFYFYHIFICPKICFEGYFALSVREKTSFPWSNLVFLHGKGSIGPLFTMRPSDSHCCRVLIISNISISKTWFMLSSTLVNFSALRVFYCRIEFIISIFSCDYQLKKWFCHSSVRLCVCNQQVFPKPHEFQWCSLKV